MNYEDVIAKKSASIPAAGFVVDPAALAPHLYPHQRDLVRWALRRGRAALFADTGLGKGPMAIEWSRMVSEHGRVIILAPLAVGPQLAEEAARFGVAARYLREDDGDSEIVITNYEIAHKFDVSEFAGVVLDESSILKSFDGRTKQKLCEMFAGTPHKLCCTATPAPNDFTELGNHSEFLGLKTRAEMLAEYFVHDGGSTQDWRIKGHAIEAFWRWVSTWGAVIKMPSDLGHEDGAYVLPPLVMRDHVVTTPDDARARLGIRGAEARTLTEQRKVRRETIEGRVGLSAEIALGYAATGDQAIVWCDLNDEQDRAAEILGDRCVSIEGATKETDKLERLARWKRGDVPILVSKAAIFGFGLNFQQCNHEIFVGATHSYERTYQAIRRCWRFGQTREVTVDMVRADLEGAVTDNYKRKELDAARMGAAMTALVGDAIRAEVRGLAREFNPYDPREPIALPPWIACDPTTPETAHYADHANHAEDI